MTRRRDARIEAALRGLDPAPPRGDTVAAEARLARILASPVVAPAPTGRPRRRPSRVLVPVGLALAAVLAVPFALGGESAFASWTATPQALPTAEAAEVGLTCSEALDLPRLDGRVEIAERRGGWIYVLLGGAIGEAECLLRDDADDSFDRSGGFFGSYDPDPPPAPATPRDGLVETASAGSTISRPGRFPFTSRDDWFAHVSGYAGPEVVAVTVHPPVGPDVKATLLRGRFAAWWPGGEARGDSPGVSGAWTYTVTLADGTIREDDGER